MESKRLKSKQIHLLTNVEKSN